MNENQKHFLKDLSNLFDRYNVEEMCIFSGKITFISNQDYIGVTAFQRRKDADVSYFTEILTKEKEYIVRDHRYEE